MGGQGRRMRLCTDCWTSPWYTIELPTKHRQKIRRFSSPTRRVVREGIVPLPSGFSTARAQSLSQEEGPKHYAQHGATISAPQHLFHNVACVSCPLCPHQVVVVPEEKNARSASSTTHCKTHSQGIVSFLYCAGKTKNRHAHIKVQ